MEICSWTLPEVPWSCTKVTPTPVYPSHVVQKTEHTVPCYRGQSLRTSGLLCRHRSPTSPVVSEMTLSLETELPTNLKSVHPSLLLLWGLSFEIVAPHPISSKHTFVLHLNYHVHYHKVLLHAEVCIYLDVRDFYRGPRSKSRVFPSGEDHRSTGVFVVKVGKTKITVPSYWRTGIGLLRPVQEQLWVTETDLDHESAFG